LSPRNYLFRYFALFSLFKSIWNLLFFDVLHYLDDVSEKTKQRKQSASRIFQNSANSQLPESSKTVQTVSFPESSKTVQTVSFQNLPKQCKQSASRIFQNSANSFVVSINSHNPWPWILDPKFETLNPEIVHPLPRAFAHFFSPTPLHFTLHPKPQPLNREPQSRTQTLNLEPRTLDTKHCTKHYTLDTKH